MLITSCFNNYYFYKGYSQIYNDSLYEIRIGYEFIGQEYLRVYYLPKNEDTCDEMIIDLKAKLTIKSNVSLLVLHFASKSDTSAYNFKLSNDEANIKIKEKQFRALYMGGGCPDGLGPKPISKFAYCFANLYLLDTNKIAINKNDTINYEICGTIKVHNSQIIEINNKGIMQEGEYYGKYKANN